MKRNKAKKKKKHRVLFIQKQRTLVVFQRRLHLRSVVSSEFVALRTERVRNAIIECTENLDTIERYIRPIFLSVRSGGG